MKRVVIIGANGFVGLYPVENPYICCDNTRIREYWGGIAIEETIQGMMKWYGEGGNG